MTLRMLGIASCLMLLAAHAGAEDDYGRPGAYLSGSGLIALAQDVAGTSLSAGGGFDVKLGYRITDWVAVDASLAWFEGMNGEAQGTALQTPRTVKVSGLSFAVNGKFIVPLRRFQPYGVVGIGFLDKGVVNEALSSRNSTSNFDAAFRLGAGLDFYLTDRVYTMFEIMSHSNTDQFATFHTYALGIGTRW